MRMALALGLVALSACGSLPPAQQIQPPVSGAFADMDSVRSRPLAPGVLHASAYDARGPWTIHVVAIDATICAPLLEARKPDGTLAARATTSALSGTALASINADFFRLPGGTPVGAHVHDGVPFIGPTEWPVFAVTAGGGWFAGQARMHGYVRAGTDSAAIVQVNRPSEVFTAYSGTPAGVTLFTARADTLPADTAAALLRLRLLRGSEREGRAVVTGAEAVAPRTTVDAGGAVLLARGSARDWARRRAAGDTVSWDVRVVLQAPDGSVAGVAVETVGGFPYLLRDGVDVLGTQTVREAFGMARHPRTAVGWNDVTRTLYFVVVDGRQPPYSDGMSLPELTWLFRRLNVTHALNLDGGGSTALVVGGSLVNRPSDVEGERPVGNALSLVGCGR